MVHNMTESQIINKLNDSELDSEDLTDLIERSYRIDCAVAASPLASAMILDKLAHSCHIEVRYNVACNDNTSDKTLIYLSKEFPKEFFEHPFFNLFLLDNPDLLKQLEPGTLKSYLNDPSCPDAFIKWACYYGYKTDHLTILKRKNLTVEHLVIIANGQHPMTSERAIERLIELGEGW